MSDFLVVNRSTDDSGEEESPSSGENIVYPTLESHCSDGSTDFEDAPSNQESFDHQPSPTATVVHPAKHCNRSVAVLSVSYIMVAIMLAFMAIALSSLGPLLTSNNSVNSVSQGGIIRKSIHQFIVRQREIPTPECIHHKILRPTPPEYAKKWQTTGSTKDTDHGDNALQEWRTMNFLQLQWTILVNHVKRRLHSLRFTIDEEMVRACGGLKHLAGRDALGPFVKRVKRVWTATEEGESSFSFKNSFFRNVGHILARY